MPNALKKEAIPIVVEVGHAQPFSTRPKLMHVEVSFSNWLPMV
jgi:hypothetical protein